MKSKTLKYLSFVGLIIIVIVVIIVFILFSNTPTEKVNKTIYNETIFLNKFDSEKFEYSLPNSITSSLILNPNSLLMYKYNLSETVNLKELFINKYKLNNLDKIITYKIDKNTSLGMDNSSIQILFNSTSQSDVFGFKEANVNVVKAIDYLNSLGIKLNKDEYVISENYFISGPGEYIVSNKTNGELQSITLYPKLKEFSYILDATKGLINLTFNKANDLLEITINSVSISNYNVESTNLYLEYLDINEVLTKENIDKNGIFLPYYSASQKVTIINMEYVYLPSKDNYLIPFIRLSDKLGLNEILVPIVNPTRIVYGS